MEYNEYIQCDCSEVSHHIRINVSKDKDWKEFSVSVSMNTHLNIWKRIVQSLRYIFKIETLDYQYVDIILNKKEIEKIKKCIEIYEMENYKNVD